MASSNHEDDDLVLPPDDPSSFLDWLDAEPGERLPNASSSSAPYFDGEEIDALVNLVLDEELARLEETETPADESLEEEDA
ncbi:MAG TPA: hypothetical protein VE685_02925 [Thermoanaerobaculia bacterium]|nr:hypothetical protein [Thermoanaerobaculia bacterium]